MAKVAVPLIPSKTQTPCHLHRGTRRNLAAAACSIRTWSSLRPSLNCNWKFYCLFSDNRKRYLIVSKGDVMLAVVFNPLLFALRGTRTGFTFLTSKISNMRHPGGENIDAPQEEMTRNVSAKERVMGKWRSS